MDLREGELFLDAQTEADPMLALAHQFVGERGRSVGCTFGTKTLEQAQLMIAELDLPRVEVQLAAPYGLPFRDEMFHGLVLRHTNGFTRLGPALSELRRAAKPGARAVAMHTEWEISLPRATEAEQEMIDAVSASSVLDGEHFLREFQTFCQGRPGFREMRFDVYAIANRDVRAKTRYDYDWRTLLRDQLLRTRRYTAREILDLIERLIDARGARVVVERYVAFGIKPISTARVLPMEHTLFAGAGLAA